MANTHEKHSVASTPGKIGKSYETSAANTALTVSTPTDGSRVLRLLAVYVKYSANVTVNVLTTLNAEHGAAYDTLHNTIALTADDEGVFVPDEAVWIFPGDSYDTLAPAGGAGVTAAVTMYWLEQ